MGSRKVNRTQAGGDNRHRGTTEGALLWQRA